MKRLFAVILAVVASCGFAFSQSTYYVDAARADDFGAGTSWGAAKQTIQAAVDLTVAGDTVMVTNGIYTIGATTAPDRFYQGQWAGVSTLNRVCITNAITVQSVNGYNVTTIKGAAGSNGSNDVDSIRGVCMDNGATLIGFSITQGYTSYPIDEGDVNGGGGILSGTNCIVTNCIISGCFSRDYAGGVSMEFGGTLNNCEVSGNSAQSGAGCYGGTLNSCTISGNTANEFNAGGCYGGTLNDCTISSNVAKGSGGGCYDATLNNCDVLDNSGAHGGGAQYSTLNYCTVSGNAAVEMIGMSGNGGGCDHSTLNNCTISSNTAYVGGGCSQSILNNCLVYDNSADNAGGSYDGTLINCTICNNSARYGGGAHSGSITNCIVWYNTATMDGSDLYYVASTNYSCSPTATNSADGCITNAPLFVDRLNRDFHLQTNSPCINVGNNAAASMPYDLDGNARIYDGTVDIGAYEVQPSNNRPTIVSLSDSPDPVDRGSSVTLTATGVADSDGTVARVEFYHDVNNNSAYDAGTDTLLATDTTISAGVASVSIDTSGLPAGSVRFMAIAYDNNGKASTTALTLCTIIQKWDLSYQVEPSGSGTITESPVAGEYNDGTQVDPSADAAENYRFDHWEVNGTTQNMPVTLDTNITVKAVFSAPVTYYVDAAQADDSGAGTNWATAKQTIQAAVDLTVADDTVIVTNGTYNIGGRAASGYALTNRVCITNAITVQSVNGRDVTIVEGASGSNGSNDVDSVRGVYLDNGGALAGFTIEDGYTMAEGFNYDSSGGGICIMDANCVVSNCILTGNSAYIGGGIDARKEGGTVNSCIISNNYADGGGGGAFGGTLNNCLISGNRTQFNGGGGSHGVLNNCVITNNTAGQVGGGVYDGTHNNCVLIDNVTLGYGGGAYLGTHNNCLFIGNSAAEDGGGTRDGELNNCTLSGNHAGDMGGGVSESKLNNCVVWSNTATSTGQDIDGVIYARNTCASDGVAHGNNGCITNNPLFVDSADGNYHLTSPSPCINMGTNSFAPLPNDLDGNDRIVDGTVDMGAYEYEGMWYPIGGTVIEDRTPEFRWSATSEATWYQVWITRDGAFYQKKWVQNQTTWTPDADFKSGDYSWWLRAWGPVIGMQAWSDEQEFSILADSPDMPVLNTPSGAQSDRTPLFDWDSNEQATWYQIYISKDDNKYYSKWLNQTTTDWTPSWDLPNGEYEWWLRGWNVDGFGSWSSGIEFNYGKVILDSPAADSTVGTIGSLEWSDAPSGNAEWYQVILNRNENKYSNQWYRRTDVLDVDSLVLEYDLPVGAYSWWVRGWSAADGMGLWAGREFIVVID